VGYSGRIAPRRPRRQARIGSGRVCRPPCPDGPPSGARGPSWRHARPTAPHTRRHGPCSPAVLPLSPVPGGRRHRVLTRPETAPSRRLRGGGSPLCPRAAGRPPLAQRPCPAARRGLGPAGQRRASARGLSPHQCLPRSGGHQALERTRNKPRAAQRCSFGGSSWKSP
jgi:hypothetical protein